MVDERKLSLTVAVATCGRPEALERCLEAIAAQTRAPDQLIVVDQDPSREAREVISRSGLTVDYHEQPRLGLSASRNLALAKAEGNVLAVTDDDCIPDPDWVAALVDSFDSETSPAALTGPILAPEGEPPPGMYAISLRTSRETLVFSRRTVPWFVGSGGNFAASIEELRAIGGWDERLGAGSRGMAGEDCELIDRLLSLGKSIRYDGRAIVRHDWQTRQRRMSTRWSYGYGIGAFCGLRLAARDSYAWRIIGTYLRRQLLKIIEEFGRLNWDATNERIAAFAGLFPGCIYGLRVATHRRTTIALQ
jgi:GT2 family glycosyltransferase